MIHLISVGLKSALPYSQAPKTACSQEATFTATTGHIKDNLTMPKATELQSVRLPYLPWEMDRAPLYTDNPDDRKICRDHT